MKITKNMAFGQLYVSYGEQCVRIPKGRVEEFLQVLELEKGQKTALDAGNEIDVSKPFNLAQWFEG